MDAIWPWIAFGLTLIVLSRAFGDNPLFRFSQYFFVGLGLGYTVTVLLTNVLVEPARGMVEAGPSIGQTIWLIPIVLSVLLFTRLGSQQFSWLANFPLAILFGVGAAVALMGTIAGTVLPQISDSLVSINTFTNAPDLSVVIGKIVLVIGVVLVLLSFSFTRSKQPTEGEQPAASGIHSIGHWLLVISLGVAFGGALLTYQTALIDRVQFITRQLGLG